MTSVLLVLSIITLILAIVCLATDKVPVKAVVLLLAIIVAVLCGLPVR